VPRPAPPPVYQRQYSGDHYPRELAQQHELHQRNYQYQPHDPVVRQHYQEQRAKLQETRQQQQDSGRNRRD
jgi:hypothetical protein